MNIKELRKKQAEILKKVETAERAQWKGRHQSRYFQVERQYYEGLKKRTEYKPLHERYNKAIKKTYRKESGLKSYQKRVKKGTDALSKMTTAQRQAAAQKARITRAENRQKKAEWNALSHGEKIRRGKALAQEKRLKRQAAGRKAWETRQRNIQEFWEGYFQALLGGFEKTAQKDRERSERKRDNDGANHATDMDVLVDVFLKYGELAHEKVRDKMANNREFQEKLAIKLAREEFLKNQEAKAKGMENINLYAKRQFFGTGISDFSQMISKAKTESDISDLIGQYGVTGRIDKYREVFKHVIKEGVKKFTSSTPEMDYKRKLEINLNNTGHPFDIQQTREINKVVEDVKRMLKSSTNKANVNWNYSKAKRKK